MLDTMKIFKRVIFCQDEHTRFLNATQKNVSYYYWGKNINLIKKFTIPTIDILYTLGNYTPSSNNPLNSIVSAFTDEIAVSEFRTTVKPFPVQGREPYESYSNSLEMYLQNMHKECKRQQYLKLLTLELLMHGYFGIYFNGRQYYYLTAYDLMPGDKTVLDPQSQPMWVRKTQVNKLTLEKAGIDPHQETPSVSYWYNATVVDELEMFPIYDVWLKDYDMNIGYTLSGKIIYQQEMPYPKRYPIMVGNTSELINSFYTLPIMNPLVEKLKEYQDSFDSVKQSAASIAKPMLVYDSDAGIDANQIVEGLKKGYKHILIGKNREGDINFKAPGQLPQYAQDLPAKFEDDIMKTLGLNKVFLGMGSSGARERGALARLIKTSFRKLSTISSIIEDVFTEVDKYAIEYLQCHSMTMTRETGIGIEEIFNGNVRYIPSEKFKAYTSEDSYEDKMFVMNQWRSKMIPTETALEQLGDDQPRQTMDKQKAELTDMQEFTSKLQTQAMQQQNVSLSDKIIERLNGELESRYWMTPIGKDRMMIKIYTGDSNRAAFLLSDIAPSVLLEEYFDAVPVPTFQMEKNVEPAPAIPTGLPMEQPGSLETGSPSGPAAEGQFPARPTQFQPQRFLPTQQGQPYQAKGTFPSVDDSGKPYRVAQQGPPSNQPPTVGPVAPETRGRPNYNPDLKRENYNKDLKAQFTKAPSHTSGMGQDPGTNLSGREPIGGPSLTENMVADKAMDKERGQMEGFNSTELESYIKKSTMIYNPDKYKNLSGMYMVEPHAKWIYSGRKMAFIMAKDQSEMLNKPLLLCGDKVYGVIILRKIVTEFDFKGLEKYHMVTERERQKWWGDNKLYLYEFEFYPFKFPLDYVKRPGQLTFFGMVQLKDNAPSPVKRDTALPGPIKQEQREAVKVEVSPMTEKNPPTLIDNNNALINV